VVNHGIPLELLDEMLEGVRQFHEDEVEVKKKYYTRDRSKTVRYNSNFDLYQAPAASWRDTLFITMAPDMPMPNELPVTCRYLKIYIPVLFHFLMSFLTSIQV
jgi:isopenicillin N synthase-like dioxygenase